MFANQKNNWTGVHIAVKIVTSQSLALKTNKNLYVFTNSDDLIRKLTQIC